jgi:hypothetical protein
MPPKNKAKAAGISASSFFDLKAELAKQENEFAKNKAAGKSNAIVGGVKRPDKVRQAPDNNNNVYFPPPPLL